MLVKTLEVGRKRNVLGDLIILTRTKPFRLWSRWDLPKSYELDDHETEDDTWIKRNGCFYNLNEFCTIGCTHIPGPYGGAQCAAGEFLIAAYQGEVFSVSVEDN